jgi:hypothetical protein
MTLHECGTARGDTVQANPVHFHVCFVKVHPPLGGLKARRKVPRQEKHS